MTGWASKRPERAKVAVVKRLVPVGVLIALVLPAAAAAAPPTLSERQAIRHVRTAVKQEFFNARTPSRPRCRRVARLRFSCRARWTDGFRRYRGRVVIKSTGLRTSPVDLYGLRAVSGGSRFIRLERHRETGRIIVETRRARFGQLLRLTGAEDTTDIEIVASSIADPFPAGEFEEPPPGTRLVAVAIGVRNRSPVRYDDNLSNGAKLVTTGNTTISSILVRQCADSDAVSVPRGEVRIGCVGFAVPLGASVRQIEFRTNGGFGRETAVWRLR
jgi:hypothetical protein